MIDLLIWTEAKSSDALDALAPVLKQHPALTVSVKPIVPDGPVGVVLALGPAPIKTAADMGKIPKGRTVTSLRNKPVHLPIGGKNTPVLFSYAPGISHVNYASYIDLLCDASAAIRLLKTGTLDPVLGKYRYVPDFADIIAGIEAEYAKTGKPVDMGYDLETIGFDEFALPAADHPGAYIVTIQVSIKPGTSDVVRFGNRLQEESALSEGGLIRGQLEWLLTTPKVSMRGANAKFDLRWTWQRAKIHCTNFKFDTNLVGSLLDENRSNALDVHAKIYSSLGGYSDEFDRTIDKSRMDLVPPEKLLPYAAGDADATLRVSIEQKKALLADSRLANFYVNLLHPAARAFEIVERGGVFVDKDKFAALEADLNREVSRLVNEAKKILGGRIVAKHFDSSKREGLNLTKASLIVDFMFSPMGLNLKPLDFTEKSEAPATGIDHLLKFKNVPEAKPFIDLMSEYNSATKTLSTYVIGFLKHLRSDGKFHPSYFFFAGDRDSKEGGTVTGRLSCKAPAFQTIPKHTKWAKRLRECYVAPPGYFVAEFDYSQGELRVIACIANEEAMIEAYRQNLDLHVITSGRFAGYSYDDMMRMKKENKEMYDEIRQLGKAGNFGLIYGMSAEGFVDYASSSYGVALGLAEASKFRDGFFNTYPRLVEYHATYKAFARKNRYVISPLGRIRHLPLINSMNRGVASESERQAINSPVQSTLSDLMIKAIANSVQAGWNDIFPCFGACHDAGYRYIPEDRVEEGMILSLDSMENIDFKQFGWNPQLRFIADGKIGADMAAMKDWKRPG